MRWRPKPRHETLFLVVLVSVTVFQGCDQDPRLSAMQQQVKQLEDNVNTLKADVKEIKEKESVDRVIRDMEGVA